MGEKEAIEKLKGRGMSQEEAEGFVTGIKRGIAAREAGDIRSWAEISAEITKNCPECDKEKDEEAKSDAEKTTYQNPS